MTITPEEFEYMLTQSGAPLNNEDGTCRVYYAAGDNEFVMQGPTGVHSLYADVTDLNRLNAHWSVFSAR